MTIIVAVGSLLLLARIAFNHPAADGKAAWRAQSEVGWQVAIAKLLLIGVFLVLIPSLTSLSVSDPESPGSIPNLLAKLSQLMLGNAVTFSTLFLLPSLCRTVSAFVLSLLGLSLALVGLGFATLFQGENVMPLDYPSLANGADGGTFLALTLILILRQFHRTQRVQHATVAGLMLIVLAVVENFSHDDSRGLPLLPVKKAALDIESMVLKEYRNHLKTRIELKNLDQNHIWQLTDIVGPRHHGFTGLITHINHHTFFNRLTLNDQLGLTDFNWMQKSPRGYYILSPDNEQRDKWKFGDFLAPAQTLSIRLERLKLSPLGSLPIIEGAEFFHSNLKATLEEIANTEQGRRFTISLTIDPSAEPHSITENEGSPLFVFIDRKRREGSVLSLIKSGRSITPGTGRTG
jgi:hypothetical protein